jgi:hypothetical protein
MRKNTIKLVFLSSFVYFFGCCSVVHIAGLSLSPMISEKRKRIMETIIIGTLFLFINFTTEEREDDLPSDNIILFVISYSC